ncbi:MAG: hypothetical protein ACM3S2_18170 [Ignavibacteriales bacterium]|jgi:hypothetical protein
MKKVIVIEPINEVLNVAPKAENPECHMMQQGAIPLKGSSVNVIRFDYA